MILTDDQILMLHKHIGYGPIDTARILVFGNESGTAGEPTLELSIKNLIEKYKTRKLLNIGEGFSITEIDTPPVNSTFIQFIGRLCLAVRYQDTRFFGMLTPQGRNLLNNYIMNSVCREHSALINLRPFPRPTERIWPYENMLKKDYNNNYNFKRRHNQQNELTKMRIQILKDAFELNTKSIIIGSGDKENKRAFFQTIYPEIEFKEVIYDELITYITLKPKKIILTDYFDNRSGIKIAGLLKIYKLITSPFFMK